MSMSDCDWIIYGPDGTVTVDIGRWESYRERRDLLGELSKANDEIVELKDEIWWLKATIEDLETEVDNLEAKLKDVSYSEGGE